VEMLRVLMLAHTVINPTHPTAIIPVAENGQIIGRMATCPCGFDAIRPTAEEAEIEAAVHRHDPTAWRAYVDHVPTQAAVTLAAA